MTNEEVVKYLKKLLNLCDFTDELDDRIDCEPYYEAVDLAIKALEATDPSRFTMTEIQPSEEEVEEEVTDIILSIARNLERICEVIRNDTR